METPNLDCCASADEVQQHAIVFASLADYCYLKSTAMQVRAKGDIERAQRCETACDRIYAQLPEWARW